MEIRFIQAVEAQDRGRRVVYDTGAIRTVPNAVAISFVHRGLAVIVVPIAEPTPPRIERKLRR